MTTRGGALPFTPHSSCPVNLNIISSPHFLLLMPIMLYIILCHIHISLTFTERVREEAKERGGGLLLQDCMLQPPDTLTCILVSLYIVQQLIDSGSIHRCWRRRSNHKLIVKCYEPFTLKCGEWIIQRDDGEGGNTTTIVVDENMEGTEAAYSTETNIFH
jgi:hypothetical protein